MSEFQEATPQVKKNLILIRSLLALLLLTFAYFAWQAKPADLVKLLIYGGLLLASFIPFYFLEERKCESVRFQNIVFSMDFVFLMGGLFLFNHLETNFLIALFLTFFISALSQSVGRSVFVAFFVIGIYVYLIYYQNDSFNYWDPILLLSCALLLVVAIHAGYLAYRTVQEEKEILELARKAALLTEKVREGDQMALAYAATLKNVLDSLPIGAIAVSTSNTVIFANAKAGQLLETHPKNLTNIHLLNSETVLGELALTMGHALKNRIELKKEYLALEWKGQRRRFRIDSCPGIGPNQSVWGTLFLLQETAFGNEA